MYNITSVVRVQLWDWAAPASSAAVRGWGLMEHSGTAALRLRHCLLRDVCVSAPLSVQSYAPPASIGTHEFTELSGWYERTYRSPVNEWLVRWCVSGIIILNDTDTPGKWYHWNVLKCGHFGSICLPFISYLSILITFCDVGNQLLNPWRTVPTHIPTRTYMYIFGARIAPRGFYTLDVCIEPDTIWTV